MNAENCPIEIEPKTQVEIFKENFQGNLKLLAKPESNVALHLINNGGSEQDYEIEIMNDSKVSFFIFNAGVKNFETRIKINLAEKNACVEFFALEIFGEKVIGNTVLEISHNASNTISLQNIKGIYAHNSRSSILGKVIIKKNAPGSKAEQQYRSVILDSGASVRMTPQLEIHNNDIKAKHGASIGALDDNLIFYLCSRGLTKAQAKAVLIKALANNLLLNIASASIKNKFELLIEKSIDTSLGEVEHG